VWICNRGFRSGSGLSWRLTCNCRIRNLPFDFSREVIFRPVRVRESKRGKYSHGGYEKRRCMHNCKRDPNSDCIIEILNGEKIFEVKALFRSEGRLVETECWDESRWTQWRRQQ
jgi:hypothetical protein